MNGAPGNDPPPPNETDADPRPEVPRPSLSARDLQENEGPIETPPGSDADQAAESPHVG